MNKLKKKILTENIKQLIISEIIRLGYFDYYENEGELLWFRIAKTYSCSPHYVKRVFFKELYCDEEFQLWLNNFEY